MRSSLFLPLLTSLACLQTVSGFTPASRSLCVSGAGRRGHAVLAGGKEEDEPMSDDGLEGLRFLVEKQRLEEQHLEVRKKARTVHMPFRDAVKWVRTTGRDFWGWNSEQDWQDWLDQGEGLSQYLPSDPEKYYGPGGRGAECKEGMWRGWDYFLGVGEYKDCKDHFGK